MFDGTVLAGSMIATDRDLPRLMPVVLVALLVYWLAHVCAELVGRKTRDAHAYVCGDALQLLREQDTIVSASRRFC